LWRELNDDVVNYLNQLICEKLRLSQLALMAGIRVNTEQYRINYACYCDSESFSWKLEYSRRKKMETAVPLRCSFVPRLPIRSFNDFRFIKASYTADRISWSSTNLVNDTNYSVLRTKCFGLQREYWISPPRTKRFHVVIFWRYS